MIKKTVALLLVFCTLFSLCPIYSVAEDTFAYTQIEGGVTITSWDKNDAYTVEVPQSIDGVPVVAIGEEAFKDCKSIYEIILPDSVVSVDASAFIGCVSLKSITVSANNPAFKTVDGNLYTKDMSRLVKFCDVSAQSFTAPAGVTSVGPYAFYGMDNLENFSSSSNITNVGEYAFYGCSSLKIFLLFHLESAGAYSFYGCRAFTGINVNLENIPEGMFYGCDKIQTAVISEKVKSVGKLAFAGCYSLDSILIPKDTVISDEAFFGTDITLYGDEKTKEYAEKNGNKYSEAVYTGTVPVTSVSFAESEINIRVDDVITPALRVLPENAEVKDVILTSSNENIVKIEDGKIKAVSVGSTTVYAKSVNGMKTSVLKVNVLDRVAPLQSSHPYTSNLNKKFSYTVPGNPEKIAVTFSHDTYVEDGEDFILVMGKNNQNIGTYTADQLAGQTLLIDGDTVNITLISDDDIEYFGFCIVKAESYEDYSTITNIELKDTELTLKYGQTYDLEFVCTPNNALYDVKFVSGDSSVVAIDSDGKIYAIDEGTAFIIVYDVLSGKTAQCRVTVEKNVYEGILYSVNDGEITLTHYEGDGENIVVPSQINGVPVTKIGEGAFMYSPTLKSVSIPACVTSIHTSAFAGCVNLKEIKVDDKNEKFKSDGGVLYSRDGDYLIACPAGKTGEFKVPEGVLALSPDAFNMCVGITKVTLSSTVELVPPTAFTSCEGLTAFSLENSKYFAVDNGILYTKDMGALVRYPVAKEGAYIMPDSVELIKEGAFFGCTKLSEITLSQKLSEIENGALSDIISLKKIECHADNSFFTADGGVLYNKNKTSVLVCPAAASGVFNIPSGTKTIGSYAFRNCTELSEVYIPLSVTTIDQYAFYGADGIGTIILPPNVKIVGDYAFDKCSNIRVFAPSEITSFGKTEGGVTVLCCDGSTTEINALALGYITEDITYSSSAGGMAFYYGDVPEGTVFTAEKAGTGKTALIQNILPEDEIEVFVLSFDKYMTEKEYTACVFCNPWVEAVYKLEDGMMKEVFFDTNENGVMLSTNGGTYAFSYGERISDESDIAVRTLPDKTEYTYGEEFVKDGFSVYFKNHAGIVSVLSDMSYTVDVEEFDIGGYRKVKVTYENLSTEFNVFVKTEPLKADLRIEGTGKYGTEIVLYIENVNFDYIPYEITWYRGGELIAGENGTSYTVGALDSGKDISAKITAINGCQGEIVSNTLHVNVFAMSSDVYSINTELGVISKISEQTTVATLLSGFTVKENIKVFKNDAELTGDDLVSTGCEIRLYSGETVAQKLTVVVTGDINGDGKISLIDFANIKAYMLGEKEFTSADKFAADANGDGSLSLIDFAQFKAHMLGDLTIEGKEY